MKQLLLFGAAAASLLLPCVLSAQVEILPEEELLRYESRLPNLTAKSSDTLAAHLNHMGNLSRKARISAIRTAIDFQGKETGAVLHYAVPAISDTQYLPDAYPFDGEAGAPVRIISAQNEYEPGAFLTYPLQNLGKVDFIVSDLRAADGSVFSKKDLDLKTVKVWYQAGNGWYSYFADCGLKLCPELLLNDEDLIKVDTAKVKNYARLTAKDGKVSYRLLNVAPDMNSDFKCMAPEFQDAPIFKGATLNAGEYKEFFLTAHVKTGQKPGLYKGAVTLRKNGKQIASIPVELRVLPFVLPKPMTYNNLNKEYRDYMSSYISLDNICYLNGNDLELAKKQLHNVLKDMAEHGDVVPNYYEAYTHPEYGKAAGLDFTSFIIGDMKAAAPAEREFDARRKAEALKKRFGTTTGYFLDLGDEFGYTMLCAYRPVIDTYKKHGLQYANNCPGGYVFGIYMIDFFRVPVRPDFYNNLVADKIGKLGDDLYFGWYANQHVGVENPAFCRRQYGLGPYRAGLSCNRNYAHHLNGYNDLSFGFRKMNFFLGDGKGVIDTISWEGYREGIDDIRYATLVQQLAQPLLKSQNYRAKYAARKAIQLIADMNTDDFDLSTARLEMTRHILTLLDYQKQEKGGAVK